MNKPSVLIIGSGIIGSGFAYAAAQRGLPMRVLSSLPVNSGGTATANSWAWINAHTDNDRNYFDLRHASIASQRQRSIVLRECPNMNFSELGLSLYYLSSSAVRLSPHAQAASSRPCHAPPPCRCGGGRRH